MRKALYLCMAAVIALTLAVAPGRAFAADPTVDELMKRIEQLEKKVAELEGKSAPAAPVSAAKAQKGEVFGQAFLSYMYDPNGADRTSNAFIIERAYLGYRGALSPNTKYAFLSDIATTPDKAFELFVKNAYIEKTNTFNNASVLFGLQGTPWTGNEEVAWKYRPLYKVPTDQLGLLSTADFGLGLKGKFAYGDYHLLVANGTGFKASETSRKKDIQARVSFTPAKSWPRFSLYADLGGDSAAKPAAQGTKDNFFGLQIDQTLGSFSYGVEALLNQSKATPTAAQANKQLFSINGNYDFEGTKWSAFARADIYDPSRIVASNNLTTTIIGGSYKLDKTTRLILADINTKDKTSTTNAGSDNTIKATVEVLF